jgi:uncharacterized protein YegL
MSIVKNILLLAIIIGLLPNLMAQEGYSSAAMSMSQQKSHQLLIPQPAEIVVEEYFNYHIHQLPRPDKGQYVALNAQSFPLANGHHLIQVGITSPRLEEMPFRQQVNVVLLIDKSGSMGSGEKLVKSKQAIHRFVEQLQPEDQLSIVAFDSGTEVLLPSQPVGDLRRVREAIDAIHLGGSTDMNRGIAEAYRNLLPGVKAGRDNRMIILTDALTNTGVVDPEAIVKATTGYRAEVELSYSLIGVGIDFNYELTRIITANGRDQVHFVSDANDIEKIFVSEVESLLYPIARQPQLKISLPAGVQIERTYGYQPRVQNDAYHLSLRDFNAGLSQVVLLEVSAKPRQIDEIEVSLRYTSAREETNENMMVKVEKTEAVADLMKNLTIARMAASLQEMARLYNQGNSQAAQDALDIAIGDTKRSCPAPRDKDVEHMLDILENYRKRVCELAGQ